MKGRAGPLLVKPRAVCGVVRPVMLPMCAGTPQEHALCSVCWKADPK